MPIEEMMEDLSGAPSFGDLFADNYTGRCVAAANCSNGQYA